MCFPIALDNLSSAYQNPIGPSCFQAHTNLSFRSPPLGLKSCDPAIGFFANSVGLRGYPVDPLLSSSNMMLSFAATKLHPKCLNVLNTCFRKKIKKFQVSEDEIQHFQGEQCAQVAQPQIDVAILMQRTGDRNDCYWRKASWQKRRLPESPFYSFKESNGHGIGAAMIR